MLEELRQRLRGGDRDDPLYLRIADGLAALVADGRLPAGERLPAERRLADDLAVGRGTVCAAYDELRRRRLVETRRGSGTRVAAGASPCWSPREAHLAATLRPSAPFGRLIGADDREEVDLRGAFWHRPDDLPPDLWRLTTSDYGPWLSGCGYWPWGLPALRRAIADHLTERHALTSSVEQVTVTSGAQQGIHLLLDLLVARGDAVVVEAPTYPGVLETVLAAGARVHTVERRPEGLDLHALRRVVAEHRPRLIYLIPSGHNPTGGVLPIGQRVRLAELAAGWDTVLVEDLAHASLVRDDPGPAPVSAFAEATGARAVAVGTLSKVAWAGLRTGWLRADRRTGARLARLKANDDLGDAVVAQVLALKVLRRIDELAAARRAAIDERWRVLRRVVAEELPSWELTEPAGGLSVWVTLPGPCADDVVADAMSVGVGLLPGTVCYPDGRGQRHLRLPLGRDPETLRTALTRVARAWTRGGGAREAS